MLKKIIAAGVILAFFACSSIDDGFVYASSSSQGGPIASISSSSSLPVASSSSSEPEPISSSSSDDGLEEVLIANGNSGGVSDLFNTYPYGYTLKADTAEDLTQFWKLECSLDSSATITVAQSNACMVDPRPSAILQNRLTTRDSPLHYFISGFATETPTQKGIQLTSYKLTEAGDQAALGLDASGDGLKKLAGVVAFTYNYKGGAHKFRIAVDDADYWEADVPASAEETLATIKTSDLKGMGSFADEETPLDISKATKFLWVVEFDGTNSTNNTGSLLIFLFKGLIEK